MNTVGPLSNGAKLDDCHSTFYSLADLKGIKWHKFTSSTSGLSDDPVLVAYTKCLKLDILAAWRQVPKPVRTSKNEGTPSIQTDKELYIFWWGEESILEEIRANKALKEETSGTWDEGLTYDCRTLLYKSMHNLIERCLLSEGFVRINRWFTKPLSHEGEDVSDHFSFSFSFFLHGERTVCTTVEPAKHNNVCRLTNELLQKITNSNTPSQQDVILCPFGLKAKLTGVTYRTHDSITEKLIEEWRPYYPSIILSDDVTHGDRYNNASSSCLPPVVEILFCGVPMNYPSSYILVPCDNHKLDDQGNGGDNLSSVSDHPSRSQVAAGNATTQQSSKSNHHLQNELLPDLSSKDNERKSHLLVSSLMNQVSANDCAEMLETGYVFEKKEEDPKEKEKIKIKPDPQQQQQQQKKENKPIYYPPVRPAPSRASIVHILTKKFAKFDKNKTAYHRVFHKIPSENEMPPIGVSTSIPGVAATTTNNMQSLPPPSTPSSSVSQLDNMLMAADKLPNVVSTTMIKQEHNNMVPNQLDSNLPTNVVGGDPFSYGAPPPPPPPPSSLTPSSSGGVKSQFGGGGVYATPTEQEDFNSLLQPPFNGGGGTAGVVVGNNSNSSGNMVMGSFNQAWKSMKPEFDVPAHIPPNATVVPATPTAIMQNSAAPRRYFNDDDIDDTLRESPRKLPKWKAYHLRSPCKRSSNQATPLQIKPASFAIRLDPLDSKGSYTDLLYNSHHERAQELFEGYGLSKRPRMWKMNEPHSLAPDEPRSDGNDFGLVSETNARDPSIDPAANSESPYTHVSVTTGATKLAGMDVPPDPYEFEDDPEDSPSYNGPPQPARTAGRPGESDTIVPYPTSQASSVGGGSQDNQNASIWPMSNTNTPTSQLEQLLMQNPYPSSSQPSSHNPGLSTSGTSPSSNSVAAAVGGPAAQVPNRGSVTGSSSSTSVNPTSSTTINQDRPVFSMHDLENPIFDMEGGTGVPTPPTNANDHLPGLPLVGGNNSGNHHRGGNSFNPPPPSSCAGPNYSAGDMGKMFPTPPSLESCCQPITPPDTQSQVPQVADPTVATVAITSMMPRIDNITAAVAASSSSVAASSYINPAAGMVGSGDCGGVAMDHHRIDDMSSNVRDGGPTDGDINAIAIRGLKNCTTTIVRKFPSSNVYKPLSFLPSLTSPDCSVNGHNLRYIPSAAYSNMRTPQYSPSQPPTPYVTALMNNPYEITNTHSVPSRTYTTSPASTPMPPTPSSVRGATSIRTPSSCQPAQASPPTPKTPMTSGGGVCRSVEPFESPASSFATQNSHRGVPSRPDIVDLDGKLALSMNLLLSDTMFNIFQDRSFDLCTLCVCSDNSFHLSSLPGGSLSSFGPTEMMPSSENHPDWEPANSCVCGFSPIRNRMASRGAGLFLEDELGINGLEFEEEILSSVPKPENMCEYDPDTLNDLVELALQKSSSPFNPAFFNTNNPLNNVPAVYVPNTSTEKEEWNACTHALQCSLSLVDFPQLKSEPDVTESPVHVWNRSQCDALACASTMDVFRLLVVLKPLLQDAIQRKRPHRSYETTQHVKGPLTWREFCKEAGKDADSQPIPSIVVGLQSGWVSISPSAIKYWDKLMLEPYSSPHDLVYLTLLQDNNYLCKKAKEFFDQLSSLYETCRLGRMWPLTDDGQIRATVDRTTTSPMPEEVEKFCNEVLNSKYFTRSLSDYDRKCLSSFIQACMIDLVSLVKSYVTSGLSATNKRRREDLVVKSIFDTSASNTSDDYLHSTMVVFMIDPFQGTKSRELMRCFAHIKRKVAESYRNRLLLQIIPIEKVVRMATWNMREPVMQYMRTLAFDTYVQCEHTPPRHMTTRSMTGFGPASERLFTQPGSKRLVPKRDQTYTPLYVLNNSRESVNIMNTVTANSHKRHGGNGGGSTSGGSSNNNNQLKNSSISSSSDVLFVSYCLSYDQKFLLVSATDQCGEFIEQTAIQITVPPRRLVATRKNRVSVRVGAINKLWQFCVNVTKRSSTKVWRIVIGKMGRASHGELRDWARFLNRKSLLTSRLPASADKCQQCQFTSTGENYRIASACLISMEPDGSMMIMPDVVQPNNFGRPNSNQSQQLRTPEDTSSTSICVVATSATTQSSQMHSPNEMGLESDIFGAIGEKDLDLNIDDEMKTFFVPDLLSDDQLGRGGNATDRLLSHDGEAAEDKLLEQPLAIGYMVSTAPCGPLPNWFWATCPTARNRSPVFLRFALHIRTSVVDASTLSFLSHEQHPLDSNNTVVLLKYVLEVYNTLSWLTRDLKTNDRQTCLPIQCLNLLQLYHAMESLMTKPRPTPR